MEILKKLNIKITPKEVIGDILICLISGIIVALAYHIFSTPNNFAPGGVSGIASILAYITKWNMGWYMIQIMEIYYRSMVDRSKQVLIR